LKQSNQKPLRWRQYLCLPRRMSFFSEPDSPKFAR